MASNTRNWNPGELVFDQTTGEPYINEFGDLEEVAPGKVVIAPDGTSLDGDDCVNAAYYRANKFQGETPRDTAIGVPYTRLVLGQSDTALAMSLIIGEVTARTPGVAGLVDERIVAFDPKRRVLQFRAVLVKRSGEEVDSDLQVT